MSLPYVVDAQTSLSPAELQVLQEQYESEASSGHITTQTKFNYAWALVKSQSRQQMLQGVTLLTGMWLGRGASACTTLRSATTSCPTTTRRSGSTVRGRRARGRS